MSSPHDENRRAELNGAEPADEDRSLDMAQDDTIYEPGPSFLEHDRPTVRLAELPAWLQRFAASTGDPDDEPEDLLETPQAEQETHPPALTHEPEPQSPSLELPSWLDDDELGDQEQEQMRIPVEPESAGTSEPPFPGSPEFMISEDDLPDWLRAISPDVDSTDVPSAIPRNETATVAGLASVPSVARAWVTRDELDALSEGGTLFALVASQASSAHVADVPESPPDTRSARGTSVTREATVDTGTTTTASEESESNKAPDGSESSEQEERNFRLAPILIGAILVVVIVLLATNFLL